MTDKPKRGRGRPRLAKRLVTNVRHSAEEKAALCRVATLWGKSQNYIFRLALVEFLVAHGELAVESDRDLPPP